MTTDPRTIAARLGIDETEVCRFQARGECSNDWAGDRRRTYGQARTS
jgi:hypothetical protein